MAPYATLPHWGAKFAKLKDGTLEATYANGDLWRSHPNGTFLAVKRDGRKITQDSQ